MTGNDISQIFLGAGALGIGLWGLRNAYVYGFVDLRGRPRAYIETDRGRFFFGVAMRVVACIIGCFFLFNGLTRTFY